jgi:hypothetical protein
MMLKNYGFTSKSGHLFERSVPWYARLCMRPKIWWNPGPKLARRGRAKAGVSADLDALAAPLSTFTAKLRWPAFKHPAAFDDP